MEIQEIQNTNFPKLKPVKEIMNIKIPNITDENIPHRNGFIWVLCGSGGSGKTSLMLNFFKSNLLYKQKFHNIFYICPESSFLSVKNHPFKDHPNLSHDLTADYLNSLYNYLVTLKEANLNDKKDDNYNDDIEDINKSKTKKDKTEYNCIIIDDFADALKNIELQKVLSKMLIKARHINTAFIFTVQSYYYFPKILRKQITYITIFKPKNNEE